VRQREKGDTLGACNLPTTLSPVSLFEPWERGMNDEKTRVLVAKPGLDGHDRGAKVIARALRDAGFEVIYTGIRQTPQMIAEAALQEDVDVVGVSILSGAHLTLCPRLVELLRAQGQGDVLVLVGGIVPDEDVGKLKQAGVHAVFGPGTPTQAIAAYIREALAGPTGP
jgi:methylmalonyl-CoA mutase C-terminal domain/subunit